MGKLQIAGTALAPPKTYKLKELGEGDVVSLQLGLGQPAYYLVFVDHHVANSPPQKRVLSLSGFGAANQKWAADRNFVLVKSALLNIED